LQALLTGIVAAGASNAAHLEICLSGDIGSADHSDGGRPAAHDQCDLCTMARQAGLAIAQEPVPAPVRIVSPAHLVRADQHIRPPSAPGEHHQRGPPAGAPA
jgi:hypothetical protein